MAVEYMTHELSIEPLIGVWGDVEHGETTRVEHDGFCDVLFFGGGRVR